MVVVTMEQCIEHVTPMLRDADLLRWQLADYPTYRAALDYTLLQVFSVQREQIEDLIMQDQPEGVDGAC